MSQLNSIGRSPEYELSYERIQKIALIFELHGLNAQLTRYGNKHVECHFPYEPKAQFTGDYLNFKTIEELKANGFEIKTVSFRARFVVIGEIA